MKNLTNTLTHLENKFGGITSASASYTKEDLDVAGKNERMSSSCQGGDRFSESGIYREVYSRNIISFIDKKVNIIEIGILKGTGIAIWNEIFKHKNTKIIACDIDIQNFLNNFKNIKRMGGFKDVDSINLKKENVNTSRISSFKFDQYHSKNSDLIKEIIQDEKFDIVIDDGDHQDKPNIMTARAIKNFLNKDSIYILEDVKPRRVDNLISEFSDIGYNLIDNSNYKDGRVGGALFFKIAEKV